MQNPMTDGMMGKIKGAVDNAVGNAKEVVGNTRNGDEQAAEGQAQQIGAVAVAETMVTVRRRTSRRRDPGINPRAQERCRGPR